MVAVAVGEPVAALSSVTVRAAGETAAAAGGRGGGRRAGGAVLVPDGGGGGGGRAARGVGVRGRRARAVRAVAEVPTVRADGAVRVGRGGAVELHGLSGLAGV